MIAYSVGMTRNVSYHLKPSDQGANGQGQTYLKIYLKAQTPPSFFDEGGLYFVHNWL